MLQSLVLELWHFSKIDLLQFVADRRWSTCNGAKACEWHQYVSSFLSILLSSTVVYGLFLRHLWGLIYDDKQSSHRQLENKLQTLKILFGTFSTLFNPYFFQNKWKLKYSWFAFSSLKLKFFRIFESNEARKLGQNPDI